MMPARMTDTVRREAHSGGTAKLNLNQRDFASAVNVRDKTVKAWEQGVKPPSGSALRLLEIAETHPEALLAITAD